MGIDFKEKGRPTVEQATCTGCGLCVEACTDRIYTLENGKAKPGRGEFLGCIACGQCAAVCPTQSITVGGRGMTPDDLVERPAAEPPTAEQLGAMFLSRRSIRKFAEREVDRATLDRILEMTSTAPMGIPPSDVGVLVFHGRAKVRAFVEESAQIFARMNRSLSPLMMMLMRPFWGKQGAMLMREFIKPLLQTLVEKHAEGEDWFAHDAPVFLLFHYGPLGGLPDCTIAATYAMLAAESLGLGSCLLGTTETFNHDKTFKARHGIPAENKIGLGLVLGHPALKYPRAVRRHLASVKFA